MINNSDSVLKKIMDNLLSGEKITAGELAERIQLSRSLTSNYLNQLVKRGELEKGTTRPTYFWLKETQDVFQTIIGHSQSLKTIIEQCKAAVSYPPNGLPVIIKGSSGVGKSLLAKKIYEYAVSKAVIPHDAPFITLNCADYANNPELLSSVLFGYVKGAFTGANATKPGILDSADGGYLFLDEVHNLSQENQEKLFILIDQQRFRRLGEEEVWHNIKIRLILATTEDTNNVLLATFRRRIPLELELPSFQERGVQERLELITHFYLEEAEQLGKQLWIAPQVFESLLSEDSEGNVGAIQNKIKISCAEAYTQQSRQSAVYIPQIGLSQYIELNDELLQRDELTTHSKIKMMVLKTFENQHFAEIQKKLPEYLIFLKKENRENSLEQQLIMTNLLTHQEQLDYIGKEITREQAKELALLIDSLQEYSEIEPKIIETKVQYKYFKLAGVILAIAGEYYQNQLELYAVAAYLINEMPIISKRHALIVMHGRQIASSLAYEVNHLVDDYVFDAFDMPIHVDTKEIITKVNDYVSKIATHDGLVILVDMGSLEKMYEEIKENVDGDLLIINNVSTALALHIGFSLKQNRTIDYFTTIDYREFNVKPQYFEGIAQSRNIVISCMSGNGIADKIKEIFLHEQPNTEIEIITMDYEELQDLKAKSNLTSFKNTLSVISTNRIEIPGIRCLNLETLVNGSQTLAFLDTFYDDNQIQRITNEIIKLFTIEGAGARLKFLNPDMIINEIAMIIVAIEEQYQVVFKNFIRVNLFLHLSSMIERLLVGDAVFESEGAIDAQVADFIQKAQVIFAPICKKYNIEIPNKEYEYIYRIISAQISN